MQALNHRPSRAIYCSIGVVLLILFFFLAHNFRGLSLDTRSDFDASGTNDELYDPAERGPRVRQATASLHEEYKPVMERAIKSHIKHGEAWGYPTHVLRHSMLDGSSFFNKISFLQMLLLKEMAKPFGQRAGWIVWFDADTILLNPEVPWTIFLPPTKFPDIHFLASKNWDGFNAGMFLIRVHEWSVKMLADAQALPSWRPEVPLRFADQTAMLETFSRPQFRDGVVYQPLHWWNEFQLLPSMERHKPNVHPGDMLIHFAGLAGDKAELMGPWLDRVENMEDQWAVPLENTTYLMDIQEYWDIYGQAKDLLDRANDALSSDSNNTDSMQSVVKASETLKDTLWSNTDDLDGIRSQTALLADALQ